MIKNIPTSILIIGGSGTTEPAQSDGVANCEIHVLNNEIKGINAKIESYMLIRGITEEF